MQIILTNISYGYDDAPEPALVPLSATFPTGWTGIVGSNGSGKSTLLRLVCGELQATSGQMTPRSAGVYCAQETERCPLLLDDFAADYSTEALRIRRVLDVQEDWPWRYEQLSQGERKRLQVAVALWQTPAVLALDEPTNHVDAPCRARLLEALAGYRGVGLLVSHDRELLDALTTQCLFLSGSRAVMRPGNYSQGSEQNNLERHSQIRERRDAKASLSHLQQVKASRDQEAARADARRSKRTVAKGDRDAKARIDLAIYSGQDGKAGRRSAQMDSRLAAAQTRLEQAQVEKTYAADVWLDAQPSQRRLLLELAEGFLAFGTGERLEPSSPAAPEQKRPPEQAAGGSQQAATSEQPEASTATSPCLQIPSLCIAPTDHIALTGPNGAGKSTLIAALLGQLQRHPDLRLLYLPQELKDDERSQQLAALKKLPAAQRGRVLSIVAQLNSDPDRILSGGQASPGETRKLMLALGISSYPQLIIMDEPTNHLDLISTEALERLLAACPCALLLVSHDSRFLETTTTLTWQISTGQNGSLLEILR